MRCEICHTDHGPHQAHVFPSQRAISVAPHAGKVRTCQDCATLRAKIAELRAENDGLRAALDMAMEPANTANTANTRPVSTSTVSKRAANKPANASANAANKVDRKAYMRELMRKRRAAAKQG